MAGEGNLYDFIIKMTNERLKFIFFKFLAMFKKNNQNKKISVNFEHGLTMVELVFAIAIVVFLGTVVVNFQNNIFSSGDFLQKSFLAEGDARSVLRVLVSELRSMNYSGFGGYPITSVEPNSIIFFSDINSDKITERLRYFVEGGHLKRGVVFSEGTPPSYDIFKESVSIIVRDIVSENVFFYFDTNYEGTGEQLTHPINIPIIKLIKIKLIIDLDKGEREVPFEISSQVSIRNLKDNL